MKWFDIKMKLKEIDLIYKPYKLMMDKKEAKEEAIRREALRVHGYDIAQKVGKALDESEIRYFFTYGNLLGLIRNGKFMSYDNDLDMGIIYDENFSWTNLENAMKQLGLEKKREFKVDNEVMEQSYLVNNLTVDFFLYKKENERMFSYVYFRKENFPYKSIEEFSISKLYSCPIEETQKILCEGIEFTVPSNSQDYLKDIYGESWRIPNPNWVSEKGPAWNELKDRFAYAKNY